MKHAPWRFKLKNAKNGYLVIDAEENHFCDVYMTNDMKIAESRARLIAAAPELYKALKDILSPVEAGDNDDDFIRAAQAAVRKAEGGQS